MNRRRNRAGLKEYAIAGGLSVLMLGLLIQVWNIAQKEEIARHAANDAKRQMAALTERESTLRANLEELATPRGKETTLRETYGVAKPGEEVIIVVPPEDTEATSTASWWTSVLKFFGL
jgi:cell division protein FtsB